MNAEQTQIYLDCVRTHGSEVAEYVLLAIKATNKAAIKIAQDQAERVAICYTRTRLSYKAVQNLRREVEQEMIRQL